MLDSGVVHENWTYRRPFTSPVSHTSLTGNPFDPPFSRKKLNLGLAEMQFSGCLEGLTCTLQSLLSRYSITFSILFPTPAPLAILSISTQIWTIMRPIFSEVGVRTPRPLLGSTSEPSECSCLIKPEPCTVFLKLLTYLLTD